MIRHYFHISALTVAILILAHVSGCSRQNRKAAIADSDSVAIAPAEYYHADNDIAMTVRSLVDAPHHPQLTRSACPLSGRR